MNQQEQGLAYFDAISDEWRRRTKESGGVIEQRNAAVADALSRTGARSLLDLGCGTGELLMSLAEGLEGGKGVDYAPSMIDRCKEAASSMKNIEFEVADLLGDWAPQKTFDMASALGLIEYLPLEKHGDFYKKVHGWLNPGGHFVVGSRNRLFNLASLNDFTLLEAELGTVDRLLREAVDLVGAEGDAWKKLDDKYQDELPHPEKHPITGIEVDQRLQFTPAELIGRLKKAGFEPVHLRAVHAHPGNSPFSSAFPGFYEAYRAAAFRDFADEVKLLPQCSTFVLTARR